MMPTNELLPSHADSVLKFAIAAAKREHQAATDAENSSASMGVTGLIPRTSFTTMMAVIAKQVRQLKPLMIAWLIA